jgi:DnaA-homolog protein
MKQLPLPIGTAAARSFDNFAVGANAAVLAHLRSLEPGAAPLYLWGPRGSGKTHLLQACIGRLQAEGVRCASFGADVGLPWSGDTDWGAVLIDDCERLDSAQQHAAFTLFVEAATSRTLILAAGRLPPVDLGLREDLRSRLGWGHVMALQPLTEHEARAELRRESDRRGILLSDDVMAYLLSHFERDMKSLFELLDRLDQFSMSQQRGVTIPLLKQMLSQEPMP